MFQTNKHKIDRCPDLIRHSGSTVLLLLFECASSIITLLLLYECTSSSRTALLLFECASSSRTALLLFECASSIRTALLLFECASSSRTALLLFECASSSRRALETRTESNIEDDVDVYSQVKFFRKSIDEVNAMIIETPEKETHYQNVAYGTRRRDYENINVDTLKICDKIDISSVKETESLEHENGNVIKPKIASNLNVRELAIRFESPTEQKGPFTFDKFKTEVKYPSLERKEDEAKTEKKIDQKLPPPVSPKTYKLNKNSCNARSLDENAFVKEFGNEKDRRKSLEVKDVKKSPKYLPDLNLNMEESESKTDSITPSTENKISLIQRFDMKPDIKNLIGFDTEKKLSRERIEKYKEERRNFLREKYSSQSFRSSPEQLTRLKLKKEDEKPCERLKDVPMFERRNTVDLGQRIRFSLAKSANNLDSIPSPLSPVKDIDFRNGEGSRSRDDRREKSSPSYNIRDMAAIFEQKSQSIMNAG